MSKRTWHLSSISAAWERVGSSMGRTKGRITQNFWFSMQDFDSDDFECNKRPRVKMVKKPGYSLGHWIIDGLSWKGQCDLYLQNWWFTNSRPSRRKSFTIVWRSQFHRGQRDTPCWALRNKCLVLGELALEDSWRVESWITRWTVQCLQTPGCDSQDKTWYQTLSPWEPADISQSFWGNGCGPWGQQWLFPCSFQHT